MNQEVKKYVMWGGSLLGALVVAFSVGRYTAKPEQVVTTTYIKGEEREKVVVVEKIDETKLRELVVQVASLTTQLKDVKKSIHREERTVTHPSGIVETTKVEDINVSKVVKEQAIQYVDRVEKVVETKYVDRVVEVEKEKIVTKEQRVEVGHPQWRVSPLIGVNVRDLRVVQGLSTGPLVYGAEVERRILGPFSAGAWLLSSGQGGIKASIEF